MSSIHTNNPTARRVFKAMAGICNVATPRGRPHGAVITVVSVDGLVLGARRRHAAYLRQHVAPYGALRRRTKSAVLGARRRPR